MHNYGCVTFLFCFRCFAQYWWELLAERCWQLDIRLEALGILNWRTASPSPALPSSFDVAAAEHHRVPRMAGTPEVPNCGITHPKTRYSQLSGLSPDPRLPRPVGFLPASECAGWGCQQPEDMECQATQRNRRALADRARDPESSILRHPVNWRPEAAAASRHTAHLGFDDRHQLEAGALARGPTPVWNGTEDDRDGVQCL